VPGLGCGPLVRTSLARRAGGARAVGGLGPVPRSSRRPRRGVDRDLPYGVLPPGRAAAPRALARRLEGIPARPPRAGLRAVPRVGAARRPLPLFRSGAPRRRGPAPLAKRRPSRDQRGPR